ncbi:hypothetical protein [Nevskia sp.]
MPRESLLLSAAAVLALAALLAFVMLRESLEARRQRLQAQYDALAA